MTERKTVTREGLETAILRCIEAAPSRKAWEDASIRQQADAIFAALPESADEGLRTALLRLNRTYSGGKVTLDADAFDDLVLGPAVDDARAALAATLPATGGEG